MAKRYAPDIHPFASSRDESPESLAALADIAAPGETLIFLQADEFVLPPGFAATMTAFGVQMIAERHMPLIDDDRIEPLGEADAADMLELATLTKPGPFTHEGAQPRRLLGHQGERQADRDGRRTAEAGRADRTQRRLRPSGFSGQGAWAG